MKVSVGGLDHDNTARASAPSSVLSRTSLVLLAVKRVV